MTELEDIRKGFLDIQNKITNYLVEKTGQHPKQDDWNYEKGEGGGITRVWEGSNKEEFYVNKQQPIFDGTVDVIEKGGVNFSYIQGKNLPSAAATQFNIDPTVGFVATGVSLVLHSYNPNIPTIHMNVRYFQAGTSIWWFGGGVDVTPVYPKQGQVIKYHQQLKDLCDKFGCPQLNLTYDHGKKECDKYFFLPHRNETRGVGGLFFDHLSKKLGGESVQQDDGVTVMDEATKKQRIWKFIYELGSRFTDLYHQFLTENLNIPYSIEQRDFQLYRRSRYVEFNLLFDRGTKFGIQSEGRIESIFMSLPALCKWKYNYTPEQGTEEYKLTDFFLKPNDWLSIKQ